MHPSLFPFVAGRTRLVKVETPWEQCIGGGELLELETFSPPRPPEIFGYQDVGAQCDSCQFQWLPSELSVSGDGQSCHFDSYINNLHPQHHAGLYRSLEKLLATMFPLFGRVLEDLTHEPRQRVQGNGSLLHPSSPVEIFDNNGDFDEDAQWEYRFYAAKVGNFEPPPTCAPISLKGRKLQVIVKLANIELTPEKPNYSGGTWHVEGMCNESIVATGIHYLSMENISESRLAFRTDCWQPDDGYEQGEAQAMYNLYGYQLNQELGSIMCSEGRTVVWPNVLQHQVQDFALIDPTKPGIRRIAVFFLVDPAARVLSTAFVPPQQHSWYVDFTRSNRSIPNMPLDLQGIIASEVDWHFTYEEALKVRLELMKERKYLHADNSRAVYERECSLCEH